MRFDIVTIFPGFIESVFAQGIVRRAQTEGLVNDPADHNATPGRRTR
ncbi:MAG: hypothetical protein ABR860_15975 [Terracidiphilus sp.]|jgi:tRNA G37 N-methylase TrmD